MTNEEFLIHREGFAAAKEGKPESANPYERTTRPWRVWVRGHQIGLLTDEQKEAMKRNPDYSYAIRQELDIAFPVDPSNAVFKLTERGEEALRVANEGLGTVYDEMKGATP